MSVQLISVIEFHSHNVVLGLIWLMHFLFFQIIFFHLISQVYFH